MGSMTDINTTLDDIVGVTHSHTHFKDKADWLQFYIKDFVDHLNYTEGTFKKTHYVRDEFSDAENSVYTDFLGKVYRFIDKWGSEGKITILGLTGYESVTKTEIDKMVKDNYMNAVKKYETLVKYMIDGTKAIGHFIDSININLKEEHDRVLRTIKDYLMENNLNVLYKSCSDDKTNIDSVAKNFRTAVCQYVIDECDLKPDKKGMYNLTNLDSPNIGETLVSAVESIIGHKPSINYLREGPKNKDSKEKKSDESEDNSKRRELISTCPDCGGKRDSYDGKPVGFCNQCGHNYGD